MPRRICHQSVLFFVFGDILLLGSSDLLYSRRIGKSVTRPNPIRITHDSVVHTRGSILIKTVDTFRRKVNIIIDITNESIIVTTLL